MAESIIGRRPESIARLRVSLVPEGRHIFGSLTVEENLRLGGYIRCATGAPPWPTWSGCSWSSRG